MHINFPNTSKTCLLILLLKFGFLLPLEYMVLRVHYRSNRTVIRTYLFFLLLHFVLNGHLFGELFQIFQSSHGVSCYNTLLQCLSVKSWLLWTTKTRSRKYSQFGGESSNYGKTGEERSQFLVKTLLSNFPVFLCLVFSRFRWRWRNAWTRWPCHDPYSPNNCEKTPHMCGKKDKEINCS